MQQTPQYNYIDIFAGCGGLSLGLLNAGWNGLFSIEKNKDAFKTLNHNIIKNKSLNDWPKWLSKSPHDINNILENNYNELKSLQGKIDLVSGGPPCQGFSTAGKRDKNDIRNKLVHSYLKFIEFVKPRTILFENVCGITFKLKNNKNYANIVIKKLNKLGYKTSFKIINMSHYGIPQNRYRFILIGCLTFDPEIIFSLLENNKQDFLQNKGLKENINISQAISDLEKKHGTVPSPDTQGFKAGVYGPIESNYQKYMRKNLKKQKSSAVDSHRFVNHKIETIKKNTDIIKLVPPGTRISPNNPYISGIKRRNIMLLDRNKPSPTLTSIPDDIIHYNEPRVLTVREYARIQSFPDWYHFKGKYTSGGQMRKKEVPRYTQIANAVPPLFAEQVGLAIKEALIKYGK